MKLHRILSAAVILLATGVLTSVAQPAGAVATTPVYAPDLSHVNEPLKDGILAWSADQQTIEATNGQTIAYFVFSFTNIAQSIQVDQSTNVTLVTQITSLTNSGFWRKKITHTTNQTYLTNVVTVTNSTPVPVTVLNVKPSCGCTTAEMPAVPWTLPPSTDGQIKLKVDFANKTGTLFKTVFFSTDKGSKNLMLRINIPPPPPPRQMSAEERARGIAVSSADRQAVFKGDCASCHLPDINGKFGKNLFDALCAICHEAHPRASMVPDLRALPVPTSEEFWRTWITAGKAGSLMPAFSTSQGGPLNDMQISSLAAYLNAIIPPRTPPPAAQ